MRMDPRKSNELYQMKELLSAIQKADSILLFSHVSPDGDTIGSALAVKMMLERVEKKVTMVLDGVAPPNLFFLPGLDCIRTPGDAAAQVDAMTGNLLALAVDVSASNRLGAAEALFHSVPLTAQIDHHGTNPGYARINLVDDGVPATAILVSRLYSELGLPIRQEEAVCLYTGLSTDTGNFIYEGTNAEAFTLMARLMEAGLPLAKYGRMLFRRKERAFVSLLGKALPTMAFLCEGEVAGMQVSQADMEEAGATSEHTEGVVDYAIDTSGVRLAYFAREMEDGGIKFSLRALSPYRVDQVAELFGGGGHPLASGCTVHAPLQEAVEQVRSALVKAWEGSLQA